MENKFFTSIIFSIISMYAIADENALSPPNNNNSYIDSNAYIQNPYMGLTSGGGTYNTPESQAINQNIAQKLFTDGTYNIMGSASYVSNAGYPNTSYAANIFAQTSQIYGFSFGGLMTVANPGGSPWTTPNVDQQQQFLPVSQVILPSELFAEYQYSNLFQMDVGRIAINNSPWLTPAYSNQYTTPGMTYQGGLININPGGGWLITGLAFNQALPVGQGSFSDLTLYNKGFDYNTNTANVFSEPSSGTIALGGNYFADNNNYNLRVWGYQFENYANMAYIDNSLKIPVSDALTINMAAQGGYEQGSNNNIISTASDGSINTTFFGIQAGFSYDWFGLTLAANTVFGPSNSYLSGGIISPYTYQMATDPLYTTSYMMGMVEKSGGNAFKITPSFNFLNNSITISPSAAFYQTNSVPNSEEYDFITSYNVSQVKGVTFIFDAAWLVQASYNVPFSTVNPNNTLKSNENSYAIQVGVNYLY